MTKPLLYVVPDKQKAGRKPTCTCGVCRKCKVREAVAANYARKQAAKKEKESNELQ